MHKSDAELVSEFLAIHSHSSFDVAIFDAIQTSDPLRLVKVSSQCAEYLQDSLKILKWIDENPEPYFDDIVDELMFVIMAETDLPRKVIKRNKARIVVLAGKICELIYNQPLQLA